MLVKGAKSSRDTASRSSWNTSASAVNTVQFCPENTTIHSKSEQIGGVYFSGQKNWRKKCVNDDDKFSRQLYINDENASSFGVNSIFAYKYDICMSLSAILNKIERKLAVLSLNTKHKLNMFINMCLLSLKFGGKSKTLAEFEL